MTAEGETITRSPVYPFTPSEQSVVSGQWSVIGELRALLAAHLPEYMQPAAYVLLDGLPLTASGKVDRRALPEAPLGSHDGGGYVAPRNELEAELVALWAEVLGRAAAGELPPIGVEDNFFVLGGHSLLATQIMARLRERWQVELPLRKLFEHPTISGLAQAINAARPGEQSIEIAAEPALVAGPQEGPQSLSFAQQRLWFLHQLAPESPAYNIVMTVRLRGSLERAALEHSLSALPARHSILRTTFALEGDQPCQYVQPAAPLALPLHDLSELPEPQRAIAALDWAAQAARRPFDLASGPLMRAYLLRLEADEHLLLVHLHHIVADGWSG